LERKKASDFPQELLNLFDRRDFQDGAKKFATGSLTLAAICESLRPNYAWAEQVPKDDSRIETEYVTVPRPTATAASKATWFVQPAVESSPPCW
jgi:carboxymethylenebutenolidase